MVKQWLKPKSVWDIEIFLNFANLYWQFIQGFSKMAISLTSILKTIVLPERLTIKWLGVSDSEVNKFDVGDDMKHIKKSKKTSKSPNLAKWGKKLSKSWNSTNFNATETRPKFLTFDTRTDFNCLWLAFIEAQILWYFDPKCYIWIETDALGYAISRVLSQLISEISPNRVITKTNLSQWHLIAFFLRKIIPVETQYETYNNELVAIVTAFKTWCHYLDNCKHEVLVLIDHNNLYCFINTKSLSFKQVCWVQELF